MRQVSILLCLLAVVPLLNACILLPGFMGPHSEGAKLYWISLVSQRKVE